LGEIAFDKKEMITVTSDTRIEDVAKMLKEHNVLSFPVFDSQKKQYIGIVDVLDIVGYTIWGTAFATRTPDPSFAKFEFSIDTVGEIVAKSERAKKLIVCEPTDTLDKLMRELSYFDHRALVAQKDDRTGQRIYKLISQTDIVKYLMQHSDKIDPKVLKTKVQEMGLVNPLGSKLYTVNHHEKALDGFRKMFSHAVLALAVIDDQGKLISTLSASDLRGITAEQLEWLLLPVLEFLSRIQKGKPAVPVTCTPSDSVEEAMIKAVAAKVHRVWVVNSAQTAVGVVTLSDFIRTVLYGDLVHMNTSM